MKNIKLRNPYVLVARSRHAEPMHDRRQERGGDKNDKQKLLLQYEEELEDKNVELVNWLCKLTL